MSVQASSARLSVYVFFSGACALLYQTVWQRDLRLIFGGSTAASGAVLAAFIGGLGAGSLLLARRVEGSTRPFALYARFEMLIASSTALTPALFALLRSAYVGIGGTQTLGPVAGNGLRVVLTALVIFVPTFFMGGTLPAVARSVTSEDDTRRGGVAVLYGLNTLGAVTGAALATFWLLPRFGNHATLWLGCLVNGTVALAALIRSRTLAEVPLSPAAGPPAAASPQSPDAPEVPRPLVLAAAFTVGAVFFLMELVWFRMLSPLLGGTVFTFGLVLCVALAGIGLGGAAYPALARRGAITLSTFAFTCLLEALAVAVPLGLGDRLAFLALFVRPLVPNGMLFAATGWAIVAGVVVFPAAFVAGVQFPVLIALAGRARTRVAAQVAQVYAANTAGSALGALAGGFGILPALSAPGTWRLAAGMLLALGAAAASLSGDTRKPTRTVAALAIVGLTVLCLLAIGPTGLWRHSAIGQGRATEDLITKPMLREDLTRQQRTNYLWQKDGVEASVGVVAASSYSFIVNGKSDGSAVDDAATQVMSAMLGALLHPAPRKTLVIGLGTGSSAGWLGRVPEVDSVDVFEFEPVILDVARTMSEVNGDVLNNPKVHVRLGDARELLALDPSQYDVIFSEPSNPYRVGVANLFTREYYQQVLGHLRPGGLFVQWMQSYEIDAETVATTYATLRSVFPSLASWYGSRGDLLLIGTRERLTYDLRQIDRRTREEPFATALIATWYLQSKEGVFSHLIAGPEFADFLVSRTRAPVNTDDFNRIEFGVARTLGGSYATGANLVELADRFDSTDARFPAGLDPNLLKFERWQAPFNRRSEPIDEPPHDWTGGDRALAQSILSAQGGDPQAAGKTWPSGFAPRTVQERLVRLSGWAFSQPPEFLAEAAALRPTYPFDVEALLALAAREHHDEVGEIDHWVAAFTSMREQPWHQTRLFYVALEFLPRQPFANESLQRLANALSLRFAGNYANVVREQAWLRLLDRLGDVDRCAQYYAKYYPNLPWNQEDLTRAARCFARPRPELAQGALRDLARLAAGQPQTLEALGADVPMPEPADAGVTEAWTGAPTPKRP